MNLVLGLLSKTGLPIWLFKILPLLLVLGLSIYQWYKIVELNNSLVIKKDQIAGLLVENSGLRDELTIFVKKAEDTAKSVESLTHEINSLRQQAQEKLDAIKQYQASDAKRCVLSAEWLRVYKQITAPANTSEPNATGGSTKPQ